MAKNPDFKRGMRISDVSAADMNYLVSQVARRLSVGPGLQMSQTQMGVRISLSPVKDKRQEKVEGTGFVVIVGAIAEDVLEVQRVEWQDGNMVLTSLPIRMMAWPNTVASLHFSTFVVPPRLEVGVAIHSSYVVLPVLTVTGEEYVMPLHRFFSKVPDSAANFTTCRV